jgi:hypothetical protein
MAFAGEPTPPTTLDLVPQYQDLHVFGDVAAGEQRSQPNSRTMSR